MIEIETGIWKCSICDFAYLDRISDETLYDYNSSTERYKHIKKRHKIDMDREINQVKNIIDEFENLEEYAKRTQILLFRI